MRVKSLKLLEKELVNYPHIGSLRKFVEKVTQQDDPVLLLLFGSLARMQHTQFSDIDLLCVYNTDFSDRKERFQRSYQYSDGIVQTKTLTLNELKTGLLEGDSFLHLIFDEGIIIFNKINENELEIWLSNGRKNVKVKYLKPY